MEWREITTATSEAERVIASAADLLLSLPGAATFNANASPHGMMDGVTEKLLGRRRLNLRLLHGDPGEKLELRAGGAELRRWGKGKIKLEAARQQKNSVNRRSR